MWLDELLKGLNIRNFRRVDIRGITLNSIRVKDGYLFIAHRGDRLDGHSFIDDAIGRGAAALLVEKDGDYPLPFAVVENALYWAPILSKRFYGDPGERMHTVGITGTNGKTTTSFLIWEGLKALGFKAGIQSTIWRGVDILEKSPLTTPDATELYSALDSFHKSGARYAVIEVSSHGIKQRRIEGISFATTIITNITRDHLDFHKSFEDYVETKRSFIETRGRLAIVNRDNPYTRGIQGPGRTLHYSLMENADLRGEILEENADGFLIKTSGLFNKTFKVSLRGRFNAYNVLASMLFFLGNDLEVEPLLSILERGITVPGRMEEIRGSQPFKVFVDYAHTPDGLENILRSARDWNPERLIVVFGAGGERDRGKRPLMGRVAEEYADIVILTNDNPRGEEPLHIIDDIKRGMMKEPIVIPNRKEAIKAAIKNGKKGDIIIVAGKGHEEYQEIEGEKIPFSDREVIKETLRECGYEVYN